MSDSDDTQALVERPAAGDRAAVERLLEQYLPGLQAFVRLRAGPLVRERESSRDLAQSVCREILDHLDRFQHPDKDGFEQWLYLMVGNGGMQPARLLVELGRRLRRARDAAGLSVVELARRAGLSRRYVTEVEAGRANVSVLKLAALAGVLKTPLRELCDLEVGVRRGERVALVGLRGAGKSSVGRELALALEAPFVELDQRVEQLGGTTLGEIFSVHGEAHFHRLEAEALEALLAEGERTVIAAGGSIVAAPENFARLRETCRTVWLRAQPREHYERVLAQGDRRPMANRPRAMAELEALLGARESEYERCEIAVLTSGKSVEEVALEVERELTAR